MKGQSLKVGKEGNQKREGENLEQMGHSDKGEKNFKKEDRSTASDWRNLRRVSVLDETSASGVQFLTAQVSLCYKYLWHVFFPTRLCPLTFRAETAKFISLQCQVNLLDLSKPKSREEKQRTMWEDNSPWMAPVSPCQESKALTALCSRLHFEDVCIPNVGIHTIFL